MIFYLLRNNCSHHYLFINNEIITHVLKPRSATVYDSFLGRSFNFGGAVCLFSIPETKPQVNHPNHPPLPNLFLDVNIQKTTEYLTVN